MAALAEIIFERTGGFCGCLFIGPLSLCGYHWSAALAGSRAVDTQHLVFLQRYFHRQATEGENCIQCARSNLSRSGHRHGCLDVASALAITYHSGCLWRGHAQVWANCVAKGRVLPRQNSVCGDVGNECKLTVFRDRSPVATATLPEVEKTK